jgi:hypothetical protein
MRRNKIIMKRRSALVAGILTLVLTTPLMVKPSAPDKDELKPEDIVAKHLEALGSQELLGSITSVVMKGTVKFTYHGTVSGIATGEAVVASIGPKMLLSMTFAGSDYPFERIAYDTDKVTTSYIRPGIRTPLGEFILQDEVPFKEGLMGGTLSTAWALSKLTEKGAKVSSGGKKKVENRPVLVLKYKPRKGSAYSISLSFDAETFQHVRTDYERMVSGQLGTGKKESGVDNSAGIRSSRYRLTELFSDFRKESGVMLPHVYKIQTAMDTPSGTQESEWAMTLTGFVFNQPLDPSSFKLN